ncbi:TPA: hypothetical protein HA242_05215 [Candidatus Woesearchaeota archaeon]|nr:hypothetical protein [Candidatus Woesearchaeota archaeon]
MTNYAVELAKIALDIKAIKLSLEHPFKWASGFFMPIYNDNRLLLQDAGHRKLVARGFEELLRAHAISYDAIAGTATAGISPATTLADHLGIQLMYVRDKPKDHGLRNLIEGIDSEGNLKGKKVVVVEDLISTGGSSLKPVQAVRNVLGTVDHLLSIFNYGLQEAEQLFLNAGVTVHSILTYDVLLDIAKERNYISSDQIEMLKQWRTAPFDWGEQRGFKRGGQMTFAEKWNEAVERKNSILCAGLDPAEYGQRGDGTLPLSVPKLVWCLDFVEKIASYSAAVKPNRNYIKDFSRAETQALVARIHELGMLAIDDSKLVDIGETNDSGLYHSQQEGFDAVTYAAFPGNTQEAVNQAHPRGLGLISLVLMSNPQFEVIKNSTIRGMKGYEYYALQVAEYGADGMVIGAPSDKNHIKDEEVRKVREIAPDALVLMPGVGAQGGDAQYILSVFGDKVIANVGRAIMYAHDPAREAMKYRDMLNGLRGS